jgi:phosphoglycolate phosphatase
MPSYFFDLDGTLTDSRAGLIDSFRSGLEAAGAPALPDRALHTYLGTPLPDLFAAACPGITAAGIEAAIASFRRHYEAEGIFHNTLYPGVREMLATLRAEGHLAWVVTSKPEPQAVRVASLLGIDHLLHGIVGASLAETDTKTELLARALAGSGARAADNFMLGDRHYDVHGALENGVTPVGALWGYGTRKELRAAGCTLFALSAADFTSRFVLPPSARLRTATA